MAVPIVEPASQGLYRVQRGRPGASDLMAADVGKGGRYMITTGEAATVNGGIMALPGNWRRAFDVQSPGFALIVLAFLLFLIHARFSFNVGAAGGARK